MSAIAVALFLAAPGSASAADLHAYAGGAAPTPAACPETATAAEQCTLDDALALAAAGDTVVLETPGDNPYVGNWGVETLGTSEAEPLTIEAAAGLAEPPVLDGNEGKGPAEGCETAACNGSILAISTNHVTIVGLTLAHALNGGSGGAIGFIGTGTLAISESTFEENEAASGGAIDNLGTGTISVIDSTFAGNTASTGPGGAINNGGHSLASTLRVIHSTFYENAAPLSLGGAIANASGGGSGSGTALVLGSTFSDDPAKTDVGADVSNAVGGTITTGGNLFATGDCFSSGSISWNDFGFNASSTPECLDFGNGDRWGPEVGLNLGPLQDNGGPTETIAPTAGSQVLGTVPSGFEVLGTPLCPTTDQRGVFNSGSADCDAGAVQTGQAIRFLTKAPATAMPGETYEPSTNSGATGNPVTLSVDPASAPGACSVSGSPGEYTVSFDGPGRCMIDANQAGDADYLPGSTQQTVQVLSPPGTQLRAYAGGEASTPASCPLTATAEAQCTLSQALELAGPDNTVLLSTPGEEAHYRGTWRATTPGTSADAPLRIEAEPGLPSQPVLDGNGGEESGCETPLCENPILEIEADPELHLEIGGVAFENGAEGVTGGAIYAENATLTVSDSTFTGGSGGFAGAIYSYESTTRISDSTFADNFAENEGGAVYNESGALAVDGSTFSGNGSSGGNGGAIYNEDGALVISNSTFAGNSAPEGAGGAIDSADFDFEGTLALSASTFSGNSAEIGDAVASSARSGTEGVVDAAGNLFAEGCEQGEGVWNDLGYNVGVDATCQNGGLGDVSSAAAADLGPLADNGGPTETILPLPTNPAVMLIPEGTEVDLGGEENLTLCPRTDQRGRESVDGFNCAAGAVQVSPPAVPQNVEAIAGDEEATLTWEAPADDGGLP